MAILKPIQKTQMNSISAKITQYLKDDITAYCEYANLKGLQYFIIQASKHILEKDKGFFKYQKDKDKENNNSKENSKFMRKRFGQKEMEDFFTCVD